MIGRTNSFSWSPFGRSQMIQQKEGINLVHFRIWNRTAYRESSSLKNAYTLLWDMKSMDGYLNIMAVIQKFFDQSISTNTSYNPQHYEDGEVPATVLIGDLLRSYSLGIKTLYYQNTYDGKGDEEMIEDKPTLSAEDLLQLDESECDSCSI